MNFALVGNPNCGKTTLFNALTGSTAHVGNWPGVTVDKREGTYKKLAEEVKIVDLPGIYSLSPYTPEEVISRNFILDEKPDCVINIVDVTNLERNLYLTTQILEIDVPVIVALNMSDVLEKAGDRIDAQALERAIGVPVVSVSALKEQGTEELMERAYTAARQPRSGSTVLKNTALAHLIGDVKIALDAQGVDSPLFHAVKIIEGDELEIAMHPSTVKMVREFEATFSDDTFGDDFEALIADARYNFITKNFSPTLSRKNQEGLTVSDKADKILTHRLFGIPIFLAVLFSIFHLTFAEDFLFLGIFIPDTFIPFEGTVMEGVLGMGAINSPGVIIFNFWNDVVVGSITSAISSLISGMGISPWAISLINDGILGGLSAVLSFLPQILILFLLFSILEDSGYMARIAFILDRFFSKFGLSGRAFMPMIMGFGCSIPAMVNTRTLADDKERTATIRVIPFFSCGAKLPILTAIAGAIAQSTVGFADIITFSMYILGVVTAIVTVLIMRNTTMRGELPPFIMELPAYHLPQFKSLMIHLWDKAKHFIEKAFTVILASTIVVWFLTNFSWNWQMTDDISTSMLASLGQFIQPLFTPLGFGAQLGAWGWVFGVAALCGLIAKEDVIATFGTLSACILGAALTEDESGVSYVLTMVEVTDATVPALISFIAFNMTTVPCFAAVAAARAELPDKKTFSWTLVFWLATSYVVGAVVYTVGTWWWTVFLWLAAAALVALAIILYNRKYKAV